MPYTPRLIIAWFVTVALAGAVLWRGAGTLAAASERADAAAANLSRTAADLRELAALGNEGAASAIPSSAGEGLARSVGESLAECGLPAATLESLSPDTGMPAVRLGTRGVDQPSVRRARATVVLKSLTLPQVGRVLDALGNRRVAWRPVGIELARDQSSKVTPGEDLPLRAVLTLEAMLVEQPAAPSMRPPEKPR